MPDLISPILQQYANFSMTGDGLPEINSLSYLPFESAFPAPVPEQRLALVLVEPRLLQPLGDQALRSALLQRLRRYKTDLRAEGLPSRFIAASVYAGPVQKDGRTVLALRRFLRDVWIAFPRFEGVTLIGNFPESTLVRTVAWAPGNPPQLVIGPELISERADIVLADLRGLWETLYLQADFSREKIHALPDDATSKRGWHDGESLRDVEFTSASYNVATLTFRDAFFLDDAIVEVNERAPDRLRLQLRRAEQNNEVNPLDRVQANIIARPDIAVARLNALHVAVNPNPALVGSDGHRFLDAAGQPQVVASPSPLFADPAYVNLFTLRDFDLERRLLNDYFDRNHRFRVGAFSHLPFRTGAITGTTEFNPVWYTKLMGPAATDFAPAVEKSDASLREYVEFLKTPAVLKYVMAHSDPLVSQFRDDNDAPALTAAVGGTPASWVYQAGRYTPSFERWSGNAELSLHRALWLRGSLKDAGASLFVHGGCNVNSVYETQTQTYTAPGYAHWNNAEAFLFYTNCVALLSRAKGFNDAPQGFADGYKGSERANFAAGWATYFQAQSADKGLTGYNIQRKRAYFWSISGDWSLRLRNRNGLGLLGLGDGLASVAVHPHRAWIDGWDFDAGVNQVRGLGDVDGDGFDEWIVTSDWGIGVLRHDGTSFRALMLAPRDTWFGAWRWDATLNPGRDRILAVANFTGEAHREILVWNSGGLATLGYSGGTLTPTRIHANGTRFGGWLLGTGDNKFAGHGRFTADGRAHMVLTSAWGLGIIALESGTALFMAPNGTRIDDWLLGTDSNRIRLLADLDGDGMDEIVITSPSGLGVLKLVNGRLRCVAQHRNGDSLGGYVLGDSHDFALADRLTGTAQHQIVVRDDTGIHVLALAGARLNRLVFAADGSRIDGWLVGSADNRLQAVGDLSADGRSDFLIRSPWGIGVMTLGADMRLHCHTLVPYGAVLGDWRLEAGDVIAGSGRLTPASARPVLLLTKA